MAASRAVVAEAMLKEQTTLFVLLDHDSSAITYAYSCEPARESLKDDSFPRAHTWRKRSFVPKIIPRVEY